MKDKITCLLFALVLLCGSALCLFYPKDDFSESERRELKAFPELTAESVFSGSFTEEFEEHVTDTFPFRDFFRAIKAHTSAALFGKKDNNGLFTENAHLSKIDYPLQTPMLDHAAERFEYINKTYLDGKAGKVFLSIIPDKNYFLNTLKYDYASLTSYMREKMPYAEYVDIFPCLELADYYFTDSHWRQTELSLVSEKLAAALDADIATEHTLKTLDIPFYGVYSGQSARFNSSDTISYLTSDVLSSCTVTSYDTGKPETVQMYNFEKAEGRDGYDFFLSGGSALLTIENPMQKNGRELIIFRDSFASSLAPLLVPGYSEITLVDIRYIKSEMLGSFVDFENTDVLFLYCTSMLNSSLGLR